MKYAAKIFVRENPDLIYKCLKTEQIKRERSNITIKKQKKGLEINIEAKDAVALRATLNSISQLLGVYEKVGKI